MSEIMKKDSRLQKVVREVAVLSLLVVGIMAARSTLADHYYVPSGSMEYTLIPGDRVLVDKQAYGLRIPFTRIELTQGDDVARGDIVIFDSPRDGIRLIKRIVAIGGDHVVIRNGHMSVNGDPLASPDGSDVELIGEKTVRLNLADGGGPSFAGIVEDGMVLAIGDHRGNSLDGRIFGAIPEDEIYGRAIGVYYRRGSGFSWRDL